MKIIELLRFNREILKRMSKNDIKTNDWVYVEMFNELQQIKTPGHASQRTGSQPH